MKRISCMDIVLIYQGQVLTLISTHKPWNVYTAASYQQHGGHPDSDLQGCDVVVAWRPAVPGPHQHPDPAEAAQCALRAAAGHGGPPEGGEGGSHGRTCQSVQPGVSGRNGSWASQRNCREGSSWAAVQTGRPTGDTHSVSFTFIPETSVFVYNIEVLLNWIECVAKESVRILLVYCLRQSLLTFQTIGTYPRSSYAAASSWRSCISWDRVGFRANCWSSTKKPQRRSRGRSSSGAGWNCTKFSLKNWRRPPAWAKWRGAQPRAFSTNILTVKWEICTCDRCIKNINHFKHGFFFSLQDHLEEVLDVVLANQRYVLAERHAQRKFLVHSLHSLNSLISDTFSITSSSLDNWFCQIRRFVLNFTVNEAFFNWTSYDPAAQI